MALPGPATLTKRLVDHYLMIGLACVFLCVSVAVSLVWRGAFVELVAATVALPLLLLLCGGVTLRRTIRLNAAIERQLRDVAANDGAADSHLVALADPQPAARGWNRLVQELHNKRTLAALESHLSSSLSSWEQQRSDAVFHSLSDGIAVCDGGLTVRQANNSLAALLGAASADELTGLDLAELLRNLTAPDCHAALERVVRGGGSTCDLRLGPELSDGVWRVASVPLTGDSQEANSTLWTVREVTQQRLADEMLNQFVATATHELRTPLTNIMAYAELFTLETNINIEQQKGFCNVINAEASRLARFVDQLLNVSQMEAGAVSLARHETDIERLLAESLENVQPQARHKQLAIESKIPAKLPKLFVDKDKLAGALVNLLGNAVKYTPEGGRVTLAVEVEPMAIHFHVEDTGIGIATDELPRLCQKFFRSQDSRVRDVTGSGLGLAYSQEVARLHGGRISVTSGLDKGSHFTLTLPIE